jgi:molybdenum cofactor cytidylyltransferase
VAAVVQVDLHESGAESRFEVRIAGLILAAGASRRMGRPKPLLELDGETFLDRLIGAFAPHSDPLLVVLGHDAETIRQGIRRGAEAQFVLNPHPEEGQLSSLQCGLRALSIEVEAVIFTPADLPAIQPATVSSLVAAMRESSTAVVVPTFHGRHGHPVGVRRSLFAELLELPAGASARQVIHRHAASTQYVDVPDPGILRDVDDPESYARLLEQDTA